MSAELTRPGCEICEILPQIEPELTLYDGEHWNANLRDNDQALLGTTFITLKRHASELDQLTRLEDTELIIVRNGLVKTLRKVFAPKTFNFSCLKNDAFKRQPDQTPSEAAHVHWHLKPRYGTDPIVINGETFRDPAPGRYLATYERQKPSRETAVIIAQTIRTELGSYL